MSDLSTRDLTLQQFIALSQSEVWKDNPDLAEQLFKYSKNIMSDMLKDFSPEAIKLMTADEFTRLLVEYWNNVGTGSNEDLLWLVRKGARASFREELRRAFDENYTELIIHQQLHEV